jgi:hypothetical protein
MLPTITHVVLKNVFLNFALLTGLTVTQNVMEKISAI